MNAKLAMIGVILITLGATLTITSYFNVNYWQAQLIYRWSFVIDSNSSSSQYLNLDPKPMSLKQIEVQIKHSYELKDFLNSTMLSTHDLSYGLNPIAVTLGDSYRNVSADLQTSVSIGTGSWEMIQPVHVFNIPDNWLYVASITVTNPENYSVILIVEVTGYSLLINNNWQTAMYLGIASIAVGAVTGISVLIRKPAIKQKETATVP